MISGDQIRAGRALARLSARELAERAFVDITTVQRLESDKSEKSDKIGSAKYDTLRKIKAALEDAGVVFLPDGYGVTKRQP
jgi:transcriptional regulator with XRE-family HTH domain